MKKQTIKFIFLGLILCGIFGFSNSTKAVWYNSSWGYKKAITIESGYSTGVATTTTNFVVVASTTQTFLKDTGQAGGRIAQGMGYDIIFVGSDDTTLLSYEIEKYASSTGSLVAFIKAPVVSSTTDQTIYMYYGNASATNNATSGATWAGSNAVGVWHLQQNPKGTAPSMKDSTNYSNHGTATNFYSATSSVVAKLDGGLSFDGVNDYVDAGTGSSLQLDSDSESFTVSVWVKPNAVSGGEDKPIVGRWGDVNTEETYILKIESSDASVKWAYHQNDCGNLTFSTAQSVASSVAVGNWYHLVGVKNGNLVSLYINGILADTDSTKNGTLCNTAKPLLVGYDEVGYFNGIIDDVRIYNYALTQADIKTQYNMSSRNDLFLTWGAEQGGEAPPAGGGVNVGNIIFFE